MRQNCHSHGRVGVFLWGWIYKTWVDVFEVVFTVAIRHIVMSVADDVFTESIKVAVVLPEPDTAFSQFAYTSGKVLAAKFLKGFLAVKKPPIHEACIEFVSLWCHVKTPNSRGE